MLLPLLALNLRVVIVIKHYSEIFDPFIFHDAISCHICIALFIVNLINGIVV